MKRLFAAAVCLSFTFAVAQTGLAQGRPVLGQPFVPGAGAPAASNKLTIKSFTGQIQIKLADGSIIGVVPGAAIPDIPAGAEIVIVSGEATFSSGGTVVTAKQGDSFSYTSSNSGQVSIAATGSNSNISVTVGKTQAIVKSGSAVQVSGAGQGSGELKVTTGEATLTTDGKTSQLGTGESQTVSMPTTTTTTSTPTETTKATLEVETGTTQAEIDAILTTIGLTADQVVVTNPAADEAIEEEEGIAGDVSPSSP